MKKSIFILAVLCATTFANAQITLEKTFNGELYPFTYPHFDQLVYGDLYFEWQDYTDDTYMIVLYDAYSYDEITRFTRPISSFKWFIAARGYFSNTNEVITLLPQNGHLVLISESGELFQDLGEFNIDAVITPQILTLSDGSCRLWFSIRGDYDRETQTQYPSVTYIYSLPGNGKAQSVSTPSSPKRSARKYVHNDQVLIDSNERTYNIQGQELK